MSTSTLLCSEVIFGVIMDGWERITTISIPMYWNNQANIICPFSLRLRYLCRREMHCLLNKFIHYQNENDEPDIIKMYTDIPKEYKTGEGMLFTTFGRETPPVNGIFSKKQGS